MLAPPPDAADKTRRVSSIIVGPISKTVLRSELTLVIEMLSNRRVQRNPVARQPSTFNVAPVRSVRPVMSGQIELIHVPKAASLRSRRG